MFWLALAYVIVVHSTSQSQQLIHCDISDINTIGRVSKKHWARLPARIIILKINQYKKKNQIKSNQIKRVRDDHIAAALTTPRVGLTSLRPNVTQP